jgi:hypothetical protein
VIITRMYQSDDGDSHFEDVEVALHLTDVGGMSRRLFPGHCFFRTTEPGLTIDWHNTPGKRMIIIIAGVVEVEVGHGDKRRFGPGEISQICLAEDVEGPGHRTLDVEGPRFSLMVDLPDDWDVHHWARQFDS